MTSPKRQCLAWVFAFPAFSLMLNLARAEETPSSSGQVSTLDTPIFRIPTMKSPPKIDGVMEESEWEDASALSGFWYDFSQADFRYLAPVETQVKFYAAFDKQNLYLAYRSPVYPESSWMKARARFPDVIGHPLYGLQWDDHIELEIRPFHDMTKGYTYGLFKWFVNPIGTISDQLWTLHAGEGMKWKSEMTVRCGITDMLWTIEIAIPLASLKTDLYAGQDKGGQDIVHLPPPNETAYRFWLTRGIGGNGEFFNAFDKHVWNTTKSKMILDSTAPSFQINELGPIMEDIIDVQLTVKNHNNRSETVRVGFFVESLEGSIYSSYEDKELKKGLLELVPGEVKKLRLKKKFPGISEQGNVLWLDVRSAGRPAKILFQTRLIDFHAQSLPGFRARRIDNIAALRPPRKDFEFSYVYSPYTNRLSAIVDKGIHGASEEAKRAAEAKLTLMTATADETVVAEKTVPFQGDFATMLFGDLPQLKNGEYKVSLLLFDPNKRIVGERNPEPFYKGAFEWEKNELGLEDVVWAPFVPIEVKDNTFETLKHRYTIGPSGLPEQLFIKPDARELPLEKRAPNPQIPDGELVAMGRGPQLRNPMRLEAMAEGKAIPMTVVEPAKLARRWQSELEFMSKLKVGPIDVSLVAQYDCDGAMTVKLTYGSAEPAKVDAFEMLMDLAGPVDLRVGEQNSGTFAGMAPTGGFELTLPENEGIVWDSAKQMDPGDLYYSRFVPFFFFGNGDRAFTWICDSDQPWVIDREGSTMTLERDKDKQVTWRVKFVNHPATMSGQRTIEFVLFVHPTRPKPENVRQLDWYYGQYWDGEATNNALPNDGPGAIDGSDHAMELFRKRYTKRPPRLYINNWVNTGMPALAKNAYTGEWLLSHQPVDRTPLDTTGKYGQPWTRPGAGTPRIEFGASWADLYSFYLERQIRLAGIEGWWWDETFPPFRTYCVASGNAYFRDSKDVKPDELPYQSNFASLHCRNLFKRLARIFKKNEVPNRTYLWANNSATMLESYVWDTQLIEGACAYITAFELDHITTYPISLFRYMSHPNSGLAVRLTSNIAGIVHPGDDPRHDRAILGRVLLHDIGIDVGGLVHAGEANRVMNLLHEIGYFDAPDVEFIPYWRSQPVARYGEVFEEEGNFAATKEDPFAKVYVTIYRRPYKQAGGRAGYQALFVVQNEGDEAVRSKLYIDQPEKLFGGPNNLLLDEVRGAYKVPPVPQGELFTHVHESQFKGLGMRFGWEKGATKVLKDLETIDIIAQGRAGERMVKGEFYGPIYIPPHNFRLLYGRFDPERK